MQTAGLYFISAGSVWDVHGTHSVSTTLHSRFIALRVTDVPEYWRGRIQMIMFQYTSQDFEIFILCCFHCELTTIFLVYRITVWPSNVTKYIYSRTALQDKLKLLVLFLSIYFLCNFILLLHCSTTAQRQMLYFFRHFICLTALLTRYFSAMYFHICWFWFWLSDKL